MRAVSAYGLPGRFYCHVDGSEMLRNTPSVRQLRTHHTHIAETERSLQWIPCYSSEKQRTVTEYSYSLLLRRTIADMVLSSDLMMARAGVEGGAVAGLAAFLDHDTVLRRQALHPPHPA